MILAVGTLSYELRRKQCVGSSIEISRLLQQLKPESLVHKIKYAFHDYLPHHHSQLLSLSFYFIVKFLSYVFYFFNCQLLK